MPKLRQNVFQSKEKYYEWKQKSFIDVYKRFSKRCWSSSRFKILCSFDFYSLQDKPRNHKLLKQRGEYHGVNVYPVYVNFKIMPLD